MAGTIISTFKWSVFRVSSLLLIILWAFNPLGSQASFRGVHLEPSNSTSPGTITYYNSSLGAQMWLSPYTANFQFSTKPIKRALFSSSLVDFVSSTQYVDPTRGDARDVITMLGGEKSVAVQAAMDVWGNPRVPSLEDQPGFDPNDPNKWIETPWREKMTNYTSLIGDRLDGINRSFIGNTSFQSSSSYQKFAVSSIFTNRMLQRSANFDCIVHAVATPEQHFSVEQSVYERLWRRRVAHTIHRQKLQSARLPSKFQL